MRFQAFLANQKGSIGPLMALIFVPVLGLTLTAMDLNYAESVKAKMQAAIDSAATAGAQSLLEPEANQKTAEAVVRAYFEANLPAIYRKGTLQIDIEPDKSAVSIVQREDVPTTMLSLAGIKRIEVVAKTRMERPKLPEPPENKDDHEGAADKLREAAKQLGSSQSPSERELQDAERQAREILREIERTGELPPELERMLR